MAAHAVTLRLPTPLYDHFSSRAEQSHRSLEAELLDAVATAAADEGELSLDVVKAVESLELMTEAELWSTAQNSLPESDRSQLEALNLKQQRAQLTPAEWETLERLVQHYDRMVLLRAEAARLLKDRGQDVSSLLTAR